jgi:cytochrome c biogenesis protein CcmG/thiol:disulfide interchange protein DsbE
MTTRADRTRRIGRRTAVRSEDSRRIPWALLGGLAAVVAVFAIAAVALSGTASSTLAEPARTPVTVSGQALAPLSDPANDPAVGSRLPDIVGEDHASAPISIGPSDGPMVIVVLAHWCSSCQAEVPVLVDYLASTGMPDGVRIVGVSTAIDAVRPNYPPSAWLDREGWTVPTLVDDASSSALSALGLTSFPGFVFVDADGTVAQRSTGEMPIQAFDQAVRALAP